MAQQGDGSEKFSCWICLAPLKAPVSLYCGHNYCVGCIQGHWDREETRGSYSCPQCHETFTPRPILKINNQLAELVEEVKKMRFEAAQAEKVLEKSSQTNLVPSQEEPKTRAELLKYSTAITMDPNTASRFVKLSDKNRKVEYARKEQSYPIHPERFTGGTCCQVLSKESLTGHCYWEVEKSKRDRITIAVSYKSISRTDWMSMKSCFGHNEKSWALQWTSDSYVFHHNSRITQIPSTESTRLGVFLDHSAGILLFYSVAPFFNLLYRVQTVFTEPLHAGIKVEFLGPSAKIVKM